MISKELRMAELLCTRLCHDLTGPIGAVSNGAEFLSEEGFNMQGQALELVTSSAFSAVARLQFYRFAYGRVKDGGEASLSDKKQMVEDFFKGSKITLDWPDQHTDAAEVSVSSKMARLLMNLLIIVSNAMLKGGTIEVRLSEETEDGRTLAVIGKGEAVKWEQEVQKILSEQVADEEMSPKTVQLYLTAMVAQELGATLSFESSPQILSIRALQKKPIFSTLEFKEADHG